jgi:hypothetical protein
MRFGALLAVLVLAISTQVVLAQKAACPPPSLDDIVYIHSGDNAKTVIDGVRNKDWDQKRTSRMVLLDPDVDITFSMSNVPIVFGKCVTLASYARHGVDRSPGGGRTPHSLGPRLQYLGATDAEFINIKCTRNPNDPNDPSALGGQRILGIRIRGPNDDDHHTSEKAIFIDGCLDVEIANNEIHGWGGAAITVKDIDGVKDIPNREAIGIFIKIHDNYIHHNQHSTADHTALGYGVDVGEGAFAEITQNVFDFNKHSITAAGTSGGYHALRNLILKGGGFHNGKLSLGPLDIHLGFLRYIHVMDVHGTKGCPDKNSGSEVGFGVGAGLGAIIGGLVGGPNGAVLGGYAGGVLGSLAGDALGGSTSSTYNCGDAGFNFVIVGNTFQYSKTTDIKIRGKPKHQAEISGNVFARKDDAIQDGEADWKCLWTCTSHSDNVLISGDNKFNEDTFGKYGVCDVDGDGIDDLVLMTGNTWWFSSAGRYPWSFLKTDPKVLKDVQLGDFDGDGRCDVMKGEKGTTVWEEGDDERERNRPPVDTPYKWMISSGARENFKLFVPSIASLDEIRFGLFDPNNPDPNRRIERPTHAFWRNAEGLWFVTPISQPSGWTLVGSSGFPLADLRFGSFWVAGVTDVLSNVKSEDHPNLWATSHPEPKGAHDGITFGITFGTWTNLNPTLSDPVGKSNIFIANTKGGKTADDVLRFDIDSTVSFPFTLIVTPTWWRSKDGRGPWEEWKSYVFEIPLRQGDQPNTLVPDEDGHQHAGSVGPVGFVGQFSAAPGASTLTIDESRVGHFFSPSVHPPGWLSDGVDHQTIGGNPLEQPLFHY